MTLPVFCARALSACGVALGLGGCNFDQILKGDDPDIVIQANAPAGAIALKNGVVLRLAQATNGILGPDALFIFSGMLADEWNSGDTFIQRNTIDQRIWDPTNTFLAGPFRSLNRVRVEGQAAIVALRTYTPTPASNIGLMLDRKSTRLNSSHSQISYAVFCLKKKKKRKS